MKIKLLGQWKGYTGDMGEIAFVDGISEDTTQANFERIASLMEVEVVEVAEAAKQVAVEVKVEEVKKPNMFSSFIE